MSRRLLIISQVYRPDHAAAGQYLSDVAEEMVRRGWHVTVLTANRGYDNPAQRYRSSEVISGVHVRRVPFSSFGKLSIARRVMGGALFVAQSLVRALLTRHIDAVLISTAPPIVPLAAIVLRAIRRTPLVYWVMDVNPDQYLALGFARPTDMLVRGIDRMNRAVLRAASGVVVLDHFMTERMTRKVDVSHKMRVIPPWSRNEYLTPIPHGQNAFRAQHGLADRFVVMYSGNHGPSAPLDTLLAAAQVLRNDARFAFVFIGDGLAKGEANDAAATNPNVVSLPYQPLDQLSHSLSAGDLHVVSVSADLIGVVHQSRVYGAFAVARPVLLIGPAQSAAGELLAGHDVGWRVSHGDAQGIADLLRSLVGASAHVVAERGARAKALSECSYAMAKLRGELCDFMEECFQPPRAERV